MHINFNDTQCLNSAPASTEFGTIKLRASIACVLGMCVDCGMDQQHLNESEPEKEPSTCIITVIN